MNHLKAMNCLYSAINRYRLPIALPDPGETRSPNLLPQKALLTLKSLRSCPSEDVGSRKQTVS
ncbi:MAG TPA: hypothetical protein V6C64_04235 [Microcoleaceae cyanobacterium]